MPDMVRMVTTAEHQYAGRRLHAGDEYDCERQHLGLMARMGWSRPKDAGDDAQQYQTRDMVAGEPRRVRARKG